MIHCQQEDDDFLWKEQHLYGSSRLGLLSLQQNLTSITEQQPSTKGQLIRGRKHYELSNHLGNVLAVVNDRKQPVPQSSASHMIDYYEPTILSATDYYPFGLEMAGRTVRDESYRFGFNGKEKDPEGLWGRSAHYDYGFRIYDPTYGRFLSVDPLARDFAWNSPFSYAENDVIRSIDLEGAEKLIVHLQVSEDGKPVLDVRTVEKAINLVQRKYDDLDVNLDVELKIGGSILSNEDFKSRKDYHWSDSYTIIGNSSQLEKIDMIAEENGWEHIGAGDGGAAARFQFYSHISTKVINGYTDPDPIQRLNFSLQHESGHPKFRFHIDNLAGSNNARVNDTEVSNELKNHGTLGHIPGTIMNGGPYPIDYDYNNTNYDLYMTRMLRYIHGTKNGERSRDELIEAKTNPQFSSPIIEDAKKIKDETDLFTKGTKKLKG